MIIVWWKKCCFFFYFNSWIETLEIVCYSWIFLTLFYSKSSFFHILQYRTPQLVYAVCVKQSSYSLKFIIQTKWDIEGIFYPNQESR